MYFGAPVAKPFTVGASVYPSFCDEKSKEKSVLGHFPLSLKPDAVLQSLKPQSTLQRGRRNGSHPGNASCGHRRVHSSPHSLTVRLSNIEATDQEQSLS